MAFNEIYAFARSLYWYDHCLVRIRKTSLWCRLKWSSCAFIYLYIYTIWIHNAKGICVSDTSTFGVRSGKPLRAGSATGCRHKIHEIEQKHPFQWVYMMFFLYLSLPSPNAECLKGGATSLIVAVQKHWSTRSCAYFACALSIKSAT